MIPRFDPLRAALALLAVLATLALVGCADKPLPFLPADTAAADRPERWQAPLPHHGETARLRDWWRQFDDPALVTLIDAAQAASPSIAAAASRIAQSRAARVASEGALLPAIDANLQALRGNQHAVGGLGSNASIGLRAGWEIDLLGGQRAARAAAQARLDGAQAGWHDARVSVAAETALAYTDLRTCEAQRAPADRDARSRTETARLTQVSSAAGFQSSAQVALANAGAAESKGRLVQRQARCDLLVKGLVAMTGLAEPALRERLAAGTAQLPAPRSIEVSRVPAQALSQRPDVAVAEYALIAAGADIGHARAARLPRVMLNGQIVGARSESNGLGAGLGSESGALWSFGPVSVTMPIFDAGARQAQVGSAEARHVEADAVFRSTLRNAVREVEEALITLQSTADRDADAQTATQGYETALQASEDRVKGGLGDLFELEDARRLALQAQMNRIELQRERVAAWITLYRALGGGWSEPASTGEVS